MNPIIYSRPRSKIIELSNISKIRHNITEHKLNDNVFDKIINIIDTDKLVWTTAGYRVRSIS